MGDITESLRAALTDTYNWGPTDMTTLLARKIGQQRQQSTSDAVLYDGDDIQDEVRNFLNGLGIVGPPVDPPSPHVWSSTSSLFDSTTILFNGE